MKQKIDLLQIWFQCIKDETLLGIDCKILSLGLGGVDLGWKTECRFISFLTVNGQSRFVGKLFSKNVVNVNVILNLECKCAPLWNRYQRKTRFVVEAFVDWATGRRWQTKLVDRWTVTQIHLHRQESVKRYSWQGHSFVNYCTLDFDHSVKNKLYATVILRYCIEKHTHSFTWSLICDQHHNMPEESINSAIHIMVASIILFVGYLLYIYRLHQ